MTARIREFLKNRRKRTGHRGLPRRRPRRRARQLQCLREGFAGHPRVLRGEGEPGAGGAVAAGQARLLLRHRLGRRDRDGAGGRRHRRPHLLRQHDQEGARYRDRLWSRHPPVRGRLPAGGREDRACRPRLPRVLPHPVRWRRRRMAAVAQVRLRAGDGRGRARACAQARPGALWRVVPCRFAAAQPACLGQGAWLRRPRCSGNAASAA